jgi:hypothetical protein
MPVRDLHDRVVMPNEAQSGDVHFAGDPATDSVRRHLERVLAGRPQRRTWLMTLAAGGAAWGIWRLVRSRRSAASDRAGGL